MALVGWSGAQRPSSFVRPLFVLVLMAQFHHVVLTVTVYLCNMPITSTVEYLQGLLHIRIPYHLADCTFRSIPAHSLPSHYSVVPVDPILLVHFNFCSDVPLTYYSTFTC